MKQGFRTNVRTLALFFTQFCWVGTAVAQVPIPSSTQFDITGFLEEAKLDPTCTVASPHCGGTLKVNGQVVTVPAETVVEFPANQIFWQEMFLQAPAPYGPTQSGLALADTPQPLTTYEVHVVGNRVLADPNHNTDSYIAGLVYVSQGSLGSGAGFINFIDYTLGEMRVGGILNDTACAQGGTPLTNPLCSGARVRINDPVNASSGGGGRFSFGQTPDKRFTADQDNPTVMSGTGFPMCLPRVAPPGVDALCPLGNRPLDLSGNPVPTINMPDPSLLVSGQLPDPRIQVPFAVGDYITYSGTVVSDVTASPTAGPWSVTANGTALSALSYVSAHTITNNVAVYTFPGTNPAYIMVDTALIGTGGLIVLGAGEAVIRTRFEGMMTDPSRDVHLYAMDLDPTSGAFTDRDWGKIGVDQGPPTGAVKGRWRFRPPCAPFGTDPSTIKFDKQCIMNASGTFLPPTRAVHAVIVDAATQSIPINPTLSTQVTVGTTTSTVANGLIWGQYQAPIFEYIFPENIPGTAIVENNFNTIDFLAKGGVTSATGVVAGVLNPWPSNVIPATACTAPTVTPGSYTVAATGSVTLAATATGTAPLTIAWGAPSAGTLSATNILNPVYTAAGATGTASLPLTVSNSCGSVTGTATVTVNAANAPTVGHVAPVSVFSGAPGSFPVTATDPNGFQVTTFTVTQSGTPALLNLTVGAITCITTTIPSSCSATVTFTAPQLPIGQTLPSVINLNITATNTAAVTSLPEFTTVSINPLPDTVSITSAEYRTSKQRLIINATSSVISTGVVLKLQPYLTTTGITFDPCTLGCTFTNNGNGLYLLDISGAPEPLIPPATPLTVQSNLGGKATSGLTRIRN